MMLPLMDINDIVSVVESWCRLNADLGEKYTWVQASVDFACLLMLRM